MTALPARWKRSAAPLVLLIGGGALALGTWIGGEPGWALALAVFYVGTRAHTA